MENMILYKAESRGHANHGWLDTYHTFSFADYYNPERIQFGALRVLNDDTIAAGTGFGRHPHDNMEIISIPLVGALEHQDSMGNTQVINSGDIQVMSAGTGIFHSEYNKNKDREGKFLQIWVYPNKLNVEPRYAQITLDPLQRINKLQQIVSPNPDDEGVWIYQDAWFYLGNIKMGHQIQYNVKRRENGVFCFLIDGKMKINDQVLDKRDVIGLWDINSVTLASESDNSEILVIDVPMKTEN
ncbi:MAG: pirin family protein [Ignavibacteriaceae bacterium]|nr:pirin family protein [Ignavibacteriaceae bacterium]